jgi:hypothetical protein
VRPFPEGNERIQVSTEGGESPVWAKNGEVFFVAGSAIAAASMMSRGGAVVVSKPVILFRTGGETHLAPMFDVSPDGQRFFMLRMRGREHVSLILNWPRELDRLQAGAAVEHP